MADAEGDRHGCCQVLELRQYTLHPGGRDMLAALFDRYFLDALASMEMHVPGMFADLDDPDRLVWLRGFPSMAARHRSLTDFYLTGEVWREHRQEANATMVDSDDVLLLAPVHFGSGYPAPEARRAPGTVSERSVGRLVVDVVAWERLESAGVTHETLADHVRTAARAEDAEVLLVAATHPEPNDFDALPVRDETVASWLIRYPGDDARERVRAALGVRADDEQVRLRPLPGSQIR